MENTPYITAKELQEVTDFLSRENLEIGGWLATKAYQMVKEICRLQEQCNTEWCDGYNKAKKEYL